MQNFLDDKLFKALFFIMSVGLFIQLAGKIFYSSSSANGVHVYFLLILPSLILVVGAGLKKKNFLSSEAIFFLTATGFFLFFSSLSAAWSDTNESVAYVLRKSLVIMLYLFGVIYLVTVATWQQIKTFLIFLCYISALGAVISLGYQLLVLDESLGWRTFRIYSMGYKGWIDIGYPVIAGIYFGFFAVLTVVLLGLREESKLQNLLLLVAILVMLPYIFQTFSRTSWVAGALAVVYLTAVYRHHTIFALGIVFGIACVVMGVIFYDEIVVELTKKQLSGRPIIWIWTLGEFLNHPVVGHGFDHSFWPEKPFAHAHNFFLQVMFEQGLVGLFFFLAMLSSVFVAVWKHRKARWVLASFSLVVYILVAMQVEIQHVITRPGLFWTVFWFPLALVMGLVNRVYFNQAEQSEI